MPVEMPDISLISDSESIFAPVQRAQAYKQQQNALARQQAVRNALAANIDPATGRTNWQNAYAMGGQDVAPELQGMQQADLMAQAELSHKRGLGTKANLDAQGEYWKQQRDTAARIRDQSSWSTWRSTLPGEYQQFVPEEYSPENQRMTLATADKALEMFAPKIQFQDTAAGVEGIDVSPDSPTFGQTRIRRGAAPKAPGTVVNVGDKGNIAATEGVFKRLINTREGLVQAPVLWQNLEDAKSLVEKAKGFMGAGGEFSLEAASFLNNRFGTDIDVEGVKNATQLRSRMFQGIVSTLKQLDSNPSQSQQAALQQALGGLGTDPNAMINVINVAQDIISGRVERYNKDATKASQKLDFPIDMPIEMPTRQAPTATGSPPPPPGFKIRTR